MVERGVYEDGTPESMEDFRARVRAKLIDCEATGDMIGGAFYCRPIRTESHEMPGQWFTYAWHIAWITEGAARRATGEFERKPEPTPEPEPEPVMVGAPEDEDGGA